MTPGTLFFDSHFQFYDGEEGRKIFATLGSAQGFTIVAKTTSQGRRYRNDFGCQSDHRFPNFHLVQGCCCLSKPTWVSLGEFYEFKQADMLKKHFSGDINRIGVLPEQLTVALMKCAIQSQDISASQGAVVQAALNTFSSLPQEKR